MWQTMRELGRRLGLVPPGENPSTSPAGDNELEALRERCADLESRLRQSEAQLRERTERLYALQQQYSSEHFSLHESARNLKIERMRNAGAYAATDVVLGRARALQHRIACLKERLRRYESVEDEEFDSGPLVIDSDQ